MPPRFPEPNEQRKKILEALQVELPRPRVLAGRRPRSRKSRRLVESPKAHRRSSRACPRNISQGGVREVFQGRKRMKRNILIGAVPTETSPGPIKRLHCHQSLRTSQIAAGSRTRQTFRQSEGRPVPERNRSLCKSLQGRRNVDERALDRNNLGQFSYNPPPRLPAELAVVGLELQFQRIDQCLGVAHLICRYVSVQAGNLRQKLAVCVGAQNEGTKATDPLFGRLQRVNIGTLSFPTLHQRMSAPAHALTHFRPQSVSATRGWFVYLGHASGSSAQ